MLMGLHMLLPGNAVRRGCAEPGHDEERAACRDRDGLVGGESVQVSFLSFFFHLEEMEARLFGC